MKDFNPSYRHEWDVPQVSPQLPQTLVFLFMAALLVVNVGLYGALLAGLLPAAGLETLCADWGLAGP